MKKIIVIVASLIAFSAQASTQEMVLDQIESNPTASVKSAKVKVNKLESRDIKGWYFE